MQAVAKLRIAGIQPLTTIEWEDRLSAVVFLQGCPWRCRYCHNHGLISPDGPTTTTWPEALELLQQRQGFLDSVVFSGGEPTFQAALPAAVREVRALGYDVALHTNGFSPERLQEVLDTGAVGYVAMDVKATREKYSQITGVPESSWAARKSAELVIASAIPHEFRTTYHPALLSPEEIVSIGQSLQQLGAQAYYVQLFRGQGCADEELCRSSLLPARLPDKAYNELSRMFAKFGVRSETGA